MLKIENVDVMGWEHAIRGMRNPMNSWDKSDSGWNEPIYCQTGPEEVDRWIASICGEVCFDEEFDIGPNDQKLMMNLRNAGTDHRKFMRMITVYVDITAPLYWWKEFDTYKVGTVANSCSTMHKIHSKRFDMDDFSCEHLINEPFIAKSDGQILQLHIQAITMLTATIGVLNAAREMYLKTKDKKYWWQMIQLLPSSYNQKRTVMLNYEVLANIYKSRRTHKLDEWHVLCDWIEKLPYSELIIGEIKKEEK